VCGIAGCYQQVDGDTLIEKMSDRMTHRGPDDDGIFDYQRGQLSVQLAHRRLSIIDLSEGGHQPFSRHGLTLSYNGELYNYRALRSELASHGVRFNTFSDTEVVLEAWRRWGPGALVRFRGMFAFAIFDEHSGRLVLARDQLGIKPLHYMHRKDGVIFASELKSLVAAVGHEMTADPASLVASLLFYWVPPERCAIDGVEKLPPGSWVEFRPNGSSAAHTYWSIAEVAAESAAGEPADLRAVIEESVVAHLVADVPISSFLSGGLDSSIVTVLAKRADPGVDAYTITFRPQDQRLEAMPDDAVYARRVADRYGITLHEIEADPNIAALLPTIVDVLDEPVGDPAAINTLLMCQAAREAGVKVVLSGMGADELFGGYRKHLACLAAARYGSVPRFARRAVQGAVGRAPVVIAGRGLRYVRWAKRFLTFAELPEAEAFRRSYTLYDAPELEALVNRDLRGHVGEIIAEHDGVYGDNALDDPVNRMCLADSRLFLPGLNLAYTDRASMATSVEVRVPFVDPKVAAAAFSFAGSQKIHRHSGKVALKEAAEAWLPQDVIDRPKASFGAPLRAWISRDLRGVVDDVLLGGNLVSSGWLDEAALHRLVDEERAGREDRSKQIWQLLTLELWCENARKAGVTV
jgi:asparagine synthase (glutamine-hydrolysing)